MRGAHLAVEEITHRYRRAGQPAVRDISFEVNPGEALALVGRSGCGKSTLLHIMAGLIPPTQGAVRIDGLSIVEPSPRWVVMFQQPSLYPWMSVAQNVALGLKFTGRKREIATRVPEMLRLVELSDYADRNVQDLSGGQQQRVALARSLAPSAGRSFSSTSRFPRSTPSRAAACSAMCAASPRNLGITLILVTHDLAEAVDHGRARASCCRPIPAASREGRADRSG